MANTNYAKVGLQISLAVFGFIALKKVAEFFNLIDTQAEKDINERTEQASGSAETIQTNPFIAFNGQYYKAIRNAFNKKYPKGQWNAPAQFPFTEQQIKKLVGDIKTSTNLFKDNPDLLFGIFRTKIRTQYQLSLVSAFFQTAWNIDLLEFLKSFLSDDEMEKILNIVKNYPQIVTGVNKLK